MAPLPGGYKLPATLKGSCKLRYRFTGTIDKKTWNYEWLPGTSRRHPEERASFSPFLGADGGVVVGRLETKAMGKKQFIRFYLVPLEWMEFIVPAWEYLKSHTQVFIHDKKRESKEKLQVLLHDKNPFLSAMALRALASREELDRITLRKVIADTQGIRRSLITYLCLEYADESIISREIAYIINRVKSPQELVDIALGVWAFRNAFDQPLVKRVNDFDSRRVLALKIFGVVDKKQRTSNVNSDADQRIVRLLENVGLREKPSSSKQKEADLRGVKAELVRSEKKLHLEGQDK